MAATLGVITVDVHSRPGLGTHPECGYSSCQVIWAVVRGNATSTLFLGGRALFSRAMLLLAQRAHLLLLHHGLDCRFSVSR